MLDKTLQDVFNITDFRPGQEDIIQAVMEGRDIFGRMPTGHGKSLCFQLPAILSEGTTLVISPLIALMRNQVASLVKKGISASDLHSGYRPDERTRILEKTRRGIYRLLYVAPEQLHMDDFLETAQAANFERITVDEAHCISHWGHDFRPSYRNIQSFSERLGVRQYLAFTATASREIADDVIKNLGMHEPFEHFGDLYRPNLDYSVKLCDNPNEKAKYLIEILRNLTEGEGSAIVYCSTRAEVLKVFDFLRRKKFPAGYYHGGMGHEERAGAEKKFLDNELPILVATNAFGMGIDKPNIRAIIHFNIPGSIESYIQETGRAGRDNEQAVCTLLYSKADEAVQRQFQQENNPDAGLIQSVYNNLRGQEGIAAEKAGTLFKIDAARLNREISRISKGRARSATPCLSALQEFQIIDIFGKYIRMKKGWNQTQIAEFAEQKRRSSEIHFSKMLEYANHGLPDQQLLLDLLEQKIAS